ncbi:MAG: phasin family protein [Chromatiaceae bacterium]
MTAKDTMNLINEMSDKGFERLTLLGDLNLRTWERLIGRQMDAMSLAMEQGIRQVKLATESKGYNEFLKGQVELAKETSERAMEDAKANLKVAGEVQAEYRAWAQQGMTDLSAELRKGAPAA